MIIDTLKDAPAPFTGTEIHTLTNGFKLILKQDSSIPVVSMQAWARCGAIDESPNIYGISHGLEHMVFKGTPTRSAGEISRSIESHGGVINAATQLETTHYYIEVPANGADAALDVLIDTILNPTFPQDELERERKVILEEIHRRDDSPDATLWDEFATNVFSGTPYEIKVIGNEKTVSSMSREDLQKYYSDHYVPSKMSFVVIGDFDKGKVLKKLKNSFETLENKKAPDTPKVSTGEWKPQTKKLKKPVQLTYTALGFPTIGLGSKDVVALDIFTDVLAGGSSSRFHQKLREEKQIVLSISCDYIAFQQSGLFAFFLDTLPNQTNQAIDELKKEIRNIEKNPIREEELNRAKARIKTDWLMSSETPRGQASTLGTMNTLGHVEIITNYLKRVEALTPEDMMDIYKRYLKDKTFSMTQLNPEK